MEAPRPSYFVDLLIKNCVAKAQSTYLPSDMISMSFSSASSSIVASGTSSPFELYNLYKTYNASAP